MPEAAKHKRTEMAVLNVERSSSTPNGSANLTILRKMSFPISMLCVFDHVLRNAARLAQIDLLPTCRASTDD